jgi:hypothetical protein
MVFAADHECAGNHLKPVVDRTVPFNAVPEALKLMQQRGHFWEDRGSISRPLKHDGLKLYRFAAARSIDGAVSRTGWIAERDPKLRKQPHAK